MTKFFACGTVFIAKLNQMHKSKNTIKMHQNKNKYRLNYNMCIESVNCNVSNSMPRMQAFFKHLDELTKPFKPRYPIRN